MRTLKTLLLATSLAACTSAAAEEMDEMSISANAGVCAVYLEATKASAEQADKAWARAPNIVLARMSAEHWQRGFVTSNGTVRTSYLMEGKYACAAIKVGR